VSAHSKAYNHTHFFWFCFWLELTQYLYSVVFLLSFELMFVWDVFVHGLKKFIMLEIFTMIVLTVLGVFWAGFWEMYDPEGYSLWFCDYKHNDENQVTFVTMNKVGGFLQRMDFIRKYAFSKMCILGESSPYSIKGVWLFRGTEIPQMVKDECYDVELYDWTKVDITQEDQKALVNAYFEEPDEIQGMKLLETKCFK
jgi:hypothetical protein